MLAVAFGNSLIVRGGPVMIPILIGSFYGLYLIIERGLLYWKMRVNARDFAERVLSHVRLGNYEAAQEACRSTAHPLGALFSEAIQHRRLSRVDLERLLSRTAELEIRNLEVGLGTLSTITAMEPMLGFLGTIIGLIGAFMAWEQLGTSITINALAAGIYQAMITTAAGLIIAIPFYIFYNIFTGFVRGIADDFNVHGNAFRDEIAKDQENMRVASESTRRRSEIDL